jgi:hypothetical protein
VAESSGHTASNSWKEQLPDGCPPKEALAPSKRVVLRLVATDPVCADDFKSNAALGTKKKPRKMDLCRWAACSVFAEDTPPEVIEGYAKLPNLLHMKFVAHIEIDEAAGVLLPHDENPKHISFWIYGTFAPHGAVKKLVPLP